MEPPTHSSSSAGGAGGNRLARGGRVRRAASDGDRGGQTANSGRVKPKRKPAKAKKVEADSYSTLGMLVSKATKPTKESGYKYVDEVNI